MREQFFPLLPQTIRAMMRDGEAVGEDDVRLTLRVAEHERVQFVTLRAACGWNTDEVLAEYNRATGADDLDDEAS